MSLSGGVRSNGADQRVLIRPRNERDIEALFRMFDQPRCRLGMVREPFGSASEVQAWFDSNGAGNYEAVATIDDVAVAFAGLFPSCGVQSHVGWISLFVHDQFQGRGIGALMMTAILATAQLLAGLRRIQLIVFSDNDRAISLYRRFGFEIEGRHECYARRGDALVDALTMARLADSAAVKPDMDALRDDLRNLIALPQTLRAFSSAPERLVKVA